MVVEPRLDEDAVVRLELEVLSNVVHDDCLGKVTADTAEVLDEDRAVWQCVLAIEAVLYPLGFVYLVKHPVSILNVC